MHARERQVAQGFHLIFLLIYSSSDLYGGRERKRIIFSRGRVLYLLFGKIENRNKSTAPQSIIRQFKDKNQTKKTYYRTKLFQTLETETKNLQIKNINTHNVTKH